MKKIFAWLCILFGCIAFVTGCGLSGTESNTNATRTVVDGTGAKVDIPQRPMRIVSIGASTDDIVMALVPPERIEAISDIPHRDEAKEASIKGRATMTIESVLSHQPDLVIAADWSTADWIQGLRDLHIPVYVYHTPVTWKETEALIGDIGNITDAGEEGKRLLEQYRTRAKRLETFIATIPQEKRLRGAYYTTYGFTGGSGTTFDELFRMAGMVNTIAAAGVKMGETASVEAVVEQNPQVIFIPSDAYDRGTYRAEKKETLYGNPAYQEMEAIKNQKVYVIDARDVMSYSQYMLQAAEAMAHDVYGYELPKYESTI